MADRPIIFSAPMVRALLDGRKTQTRRIVKVPGIMGGRYPILPPEDAIELEDGEFSRGIFHYASTGALPGSNPVARLSDTDRRAARAALEALRNPTEEMLQAGVNTPGMRAITEALAMHEMRGMGYPDDAFADGSPLLQAWRAGIGVALGE